MAQKNYRYLAQLISDTYYKSKTSDDANYDLRYFAEQVASEVAEQATIDAYNNAKSGEAVYANDQFLSVYKNLPIVDDSGEKHIVLPATPAGLPKNREIVQVKVTGATCMECIPMRNYASFSQSLIGIPPGMVLYKIEAGKIVFETDNPLFGGTAMVRMVGAVSGGSLLDSPLDIPKNVQGRIMDVILRRILPIKQVPVDNINDSISNPA